MHQMTIILCVAVVVTIRASHEFDRSEWKDCRKSGIRTKYNYPNKLYFSGLPSYGSMNTPMTYHSIRLTDEHRRRKDEKAKTQLRDRNLPIRASRGLLTDLLKTAIKSSVNVAGATASLTKDLVVDSVKGAGEVVRGSAKLTTDLIHGSLNVTKQAISWMTGKTMQIGNFIIEVPRQGIELSVNAAWTAHKFGAGLTNQIMSDTANWFEGNWQAVKAMEFPGKKLIVMLYPSGFISVVNQLTKELMYMVDEGSQILTYAFAHTLYISLKIVFDSVHLVIRAGGLNCVKYSPITIPVNEKFIGTISAERSKTCGIAHLKPVNNITIRRNDEKMLIVSSPWVIEDISVHLTGVEVVGQGIIGKVIDNEVMTTHVERVKATGTVSFEAGTLLRFVQIHLAVDEIEGLKVKFHTNKTNFYMDVVENMSDKVSFLVTKEINRIFNKIEEKVFNSIAHLSSWPKKLAG